MPSAWTNQERRDLAVQPVLFAVRARVLDGPPGGIAEVYLAFDHVPPRWRVRIFEIGHERLGARVQGIDHHLPVRWTRDLYPPVHQVVRDGSDPPRVVPHPPGGLREVERHSLIHPRLALSSPTQQVQAGGIEPSVEVRDELERFPREEFEASPVHRGANLGRLVCRARRIASNRKRISPRTEHMFHGTQLPSRSDASRGP